MTTYEQGKRAAFFSSPPGDNTLLLTRMAGEEGVSQLFRFSIDTLSENPAIAPAEVIGKAATVSVELADGQKRHFNGIVTRFEQGGRSSRLTSYRLELCPWLWLLTRRSDCRIFQNMSVPDILKKVFDKAGMTAFKMSLRGSYAPRVYCVQYRETDFNFVSRLMEEEGIFFYFTHDESSHTLVLVDSTEGLPDCPNQASVIFAGSSGGNNDRDDITSWDMGTSLTAGKYALKDYNFEDPGNALLVSTKSKTPIGGNDKFELYDHQPGEYGKSGEGNAIVKVRNEEQDTASVRIAGSSDCRAFVTGHKFTLKEHFRADQNDKAYLLVSVQHSFVQPSDLESGGYAEQAYQNSFSCVPISTPFRSPRVTPRPMIAGPQTAVVVGPAGEEIFVDKYGRVKVQFHWDREGKLDDGSSCWVRVTQTWAGKQWGAHHHPRIGDEVIVEFLEGDPDKPIITGCVYNAQRMPPYALPANATRSGIKTRSSKGGSPDNFNELRFEDAKGKEEVYVHAEKDHNTVVENDQSTKVGHDQSTTVGHDQTEDVSHNQTKHVGNDRSLTVDKNETESIGGNRTISVSKDHSESISGDMVVTVEKSRTLAVTKNLTESVDGEMSLSVAKDRTTTISGSMKVSVSKDMTITVDGKQQETITKDCSLQAKTITMTAEDEITLKTGSAKIILKKNGDITIQGNKINVKGDGDVVIKGSKVLSN